MQKLEDTFPDSGWEGPGLEVGQRLPLWPLKSATWSRQIYRTTEDSQAGPSQLPSPPDPEVQKIDYMLVYFTVRQPPAFRLLQLSKPFGVAWRSQSGASAA